MSPPHPPPPKKDVALALLERSSMFVHLDPRLDIVKVPPWFKKQPQLVLQVGLNMAIPIPDLHLDEEGLACTLSFSHSPFYCVVPWASVFALVSDDGSGRGMVWEKDMPAELHQAAQKQKAPPLAAKPRAVAEAAPPDESVTESTAPPSGPATSSGPEGEGEPKPKKTRRKAPAKEGEKVLVAKKVPPVDAERLPVVMQPAPPPQPQPLRAPQPAARKPAPHVGLAPKKPKRELPPYLRVVK